MIALISDGCPDTDVVLCEADLTGAITCLDGQTGEDRQDEEPAALKVESESYDLRVGERSSSKRQRKATHAAFGSARGTRSQGARREGLPPRAPLPPGWSIRDVINADGRQCELDNLSFVLTMSCTKSCNGFACCITTYVLPTSHKRLI
jgi:hypothetical protein